MDSLHYHKSRCSICLCFTLPLFLLRYTNGQCWWVAKGWHSTSEPACALTKPCSTTSNCYLQPPFMPAVAAGYGARRSCHWSVSPKPASPALSCRGELEKSRGRKDWASLWWQLLSSSFSLERFPACLQYSSGSFERRCPQRELRCNQDGQSCADAQMGCLQSLLVP